MGTLAGIGLGTNLGDRMGHLCDARAELEALAGVKLLAASNIYETEPVGVPAEYAHMAFLNAVLLFDVELDVEEWSDHVHAIEDKLLRVRTEVRNTPRTIDLDLLFFGDVVMERPHLHLPHPQCRNRRFVCMPLCDVAPDLHLPGEDTRSMKEVLAAMPELPAVKLYSTEWISVANNL
jgi:2-amino-4-hydroxy-6-hydroxymethyldihydropteridine diphosphokinase